MNSKSLINHIAIVARNFQVIEAIYLFGSRAVGRHTVQSDLDLAVLLAKDNEASFSILDFIVDIENVTNLHVDVTILNRAGELLKYEVRRDGKVIYDIAPHSRKMFEVLGRKRYEDFLYVHKKYTKKVLYGGV